MKTIKFKFLAPILAIAFAVTSAFSTTTETEEGVSLPIDGYVDYITPCMTPPVECLTEAAFLCTNNLNQQVYGKWNELDTTCPRVVFKN